MDILGYKLYSKQQYDDTHICKDCSEQIPINTDSDSISAIENTGNIAVSHCIACEENINRRGSKNINYPEEIGNLFYKTFKDKSPRFGGVHPRIDSAGFEEKEYSDHAKKFEPIQTNHNRVIIRVESEDLANDVNNMIDKLSKIGRIRGIMEEIEEKNGDRVKYHFEIFPVLD